MIIYLYLAYAAAWVIHIVYLAILTRRFARVREEAAELAESPQTGRARD